MSNLVVSNISDGTTSVGTGYVVNGSAKAWVNFNGTGTVAIRDSLNVSSITDSGTGDYNVNIANAMANVNYATTIGVASASTSREKIGFIQSGTYSTTAFRILTGFTYVSPGAEDMGIVSSSSSGDLA